MKLDHPALAWAYDFFMPEEGGCSAAMLLGTWGSLPARSEQN
jgi:hypothetical protein